MREKLFSTIAGVRARVLYSRSAYALLLGDLPSGLYAHWCDTASHEFKGIPRDAFFFARAAEALMEFFDCVSRSASPCGLPSKAADSVWHAWAQLAPAHLERFCMEHFARPIPHIEAAGMPEPMNAALGVCLVAARRIEQKAPAGPYVPTLFSLDQSLRMPFGFAYSMKERELAFRSMGASGRPDGNLVFPIALQAHQLFVAGLVTRAEYIPYAPAVLNRDRARDGGAGAVCGSFSSSADCGDGGGADSGSSCGSGCGGGGD